MSGPNEYYDWLPEARQIAAQCWCDDETKHLVMEPALAEAVARRVAAWMQTGAQHARNEGYWRDRALKAEAAPIVPQGWKLVPVEPTPKKMMTGSGAPSFCWQCGTQLQRAPGKGAGLFFFNLVTGPDGHQHRIHGDCTEQAVLDGCKLLSVPDGVEGKTNG